jgi:hypothetical protein
MRRVQERLLENDPSLNNCTMRFTLDRSKRRRHLRKAGVAISIIEVDNDGGAFTNEVLSFAIDPTEYTGKKVLAVPRCCQVQKGTQDRQRWNDLVAERDREIQRC